MATASASAASARFCAAPGSKRRTISPTCSLSAPPVPTTAIFTVLAPYSNTGIPSLAGRVAGEYLGKLVIERFKAERDRFVTIGGNHPICHMAQPVTLGLQHTP